MLNSYITKDVDSNVNGLKGPPEVVRAPCKGDIHHNAHDGGKFGLGMVIRAELNH